jgi:predicted glycoside hydrolase/deacetylase ChbG (UPF0249 family)
MKYLIVNGDDFGASAGINRAIMEAHGHGILTSTSLMVTMPWAEQAALMSRTMLNLSVGLHVHLADKGRDAERRSFAGCAAQLWRQLRRFKELLGRLPAHLDSHHNIHHIPKLLPYFLDLAQEDHLPLRRYSPVRYFAQFYGQWDGETHLEQISVESLQRMLRTQIHAGITELSCHPGYCDRATDTGYVVEREAELRTLCDLRIRQVLAEQQIRLISFADLEQLLAQVPE